MWKNRKNKIFIYLQLKDIWCFTKFLLSSQCNMHSVIFSQISSRLKNFPSNQSPIFLISFLQKEGFCIVRYGFIKSHENVKCNVEFVLVVRVEIFQIDHFIAEQLVVEVSKLQTHVITFLYHPVQIFQLIHVLQSVYFYAK